MSAKPKVIAKCLAQKRIFCTAMDRSINEDESTAKGLSTLQLYNMNTMKPSGVLVVYKTSARDRGVALNMCPWCGELVRPDMKRKAATP